MMPTMRSTWERSESSKRSTGVARDLSTGSPRRRMNDIAAARRAATSGSSASLLLLVVVRCGSSRLGRLRTDVHPPSSTSG